VNCLDETTYNTLLITLLLGKRFGNLPNPHITHQQPKQPQDNLWLHEHENSSPSSFYNEKHM